MSYEKDQNKRAVLAAIWDDPSRAFGCNFKQSGQKQYNLRGGQYDEAEKIGLMQTGGGSNIVVFYNGASRQEKTPVLDYLAQYHLQTAGFLDTLKALADLYGLDLTFSPEQRQAMRRGELAREVAASLVEALRQNPDGAAARYLRETRRFDLDKVGRFFGELTPESIARAKEALRVRGKTYDPKDLEALGVTEERARQGYGLVIPCIRNGVVQALALRNIQQGFKGSAKYLYPSGVSRTAYCDALTYGAPAVVVEGQLDAVRLMGEGVQNVVAMGGASIDEDAKAMLHGRGITEITYIPDLEFDPGRNPVTKTTEDAIKAFQSARVDGQPVFKCVLVAELPRPDDMFTNDKYKVFKDGAVKKYKTDADTFGADNPGQLPSLIEISPVAAWAWEVERIRERAATDSAQGRNPTAAVEAAIIDTYGRLSSPIECQRMRHHIGKNCTDLAPYGVTEKALEDLDGWARGRQYNNRVKEASEDLRKAVEAGTAGPEKVAAIGQRLRDALAAGSRAEWDRQAESEFKDILEELAQQPETLKSGWTLGRVGTKTSSDPKFCDGKTLEFFPQDITVFCAATSHGKTAILFSAALDMVERYPDKTFILLSCEESRRQLNERSINAYLDIASDEGGKDSAGRPCFIEGHRKKTLKAILRDAPAPDCYDGQFMGRSNDYEALKKRVCEGLAQYGRAIHPRLKILHVEATAESIAANAVSIVEKFRAAGVEVGAVFLDYIQLITSEAKTFSRVDEMKEICKTFKDMAASLKAPLIVAAQLNREVQKPAKNGLSPLDEITVANIGEASEIEKIAQGVFLVWKIDKTPEGWYKSANSVTGKPYVDNKKITGHRLNRLFYRADEYNPGERELKAGYLYIEQLKGRDEATGRWGLLRFDGERGRVGENDTKAMEG